MIYLKLSIRNAKRSFINYLLYVVAMTVLLAIIEVSNCIAIIGGISWFSSGFHALANYSNPNHFTGIYRYFHAKAAGKGICKLFIIRYGKKRLTRLFFM